MKDQNNQFHHSYLKDLYYTAFAHSDDSDKQVGAIITTTDGQVIRVANELPLGITQTANRVTKPLKYHYIDHAERTAIAEAARLGIKTQDATMYVTWFPCVECAKAIINSGIKRLFCQPQDVNFFEETRYHFDVALELLKESMVEIISWKEEELYNENK